MESGVFGECLIQLQDLLSEISEENYDKTKEEIYQLRFINYGIIIQEILCAVPIRPTKIMQYINLLADMSRENVKFKDLKAKMLNYIVFSLNSNDLIQQNLSSYVFLRLCYEQKVFSFQEIASSFTHYIENPSTCIFKYPFAGIAFQNIIYFHEFFIFARYFQSKSDGIKFLMDDSALVQIIKHDDIESFQLLTLSPEFDYNAIIPVNPFNIYPILRKEHNIAQCAAAYGSEKIFRFLFLNISHDYDLSTYAVAGGNFEIIRILDQNGVDFSHCLEIAIQYHHQEVFRWIVITKIGEDKEALYKEIIMKSSVSHNNVKIAFRCVSIIGPDGKTPLHHSSICGWYGITKLFLISDPEILYKADSNGDMPHHYAAANNHSHILRLLYSHCSQKNPMIFDGSGESVFIKAINSFSIDALKVIFEMGVYSFSDIKFFSCNDIQIYNHIEISPQDIKATFSIDYYYYFYGGRNYLSYLTDQYRAPVVDFIKYSAFISKIIRFPYVDINSYLNNSLSFICHVIETGAHFLIPKLLSHPDISIMKSSNGGKSPIEMIISRGSLNSLSYFNNKTKHHLTDTDIYYIQSTLLSNFQRINNDSMIKIFSIPAIDLNLLDYKNNSFLHLSIKYERIPIIEFLLNDDRCNVNLPGENNQSPYSLASQSLPQIFELFLKCSRVIRHSIPTLSRANNTVLRQYL